MERTMDHTMQRFLCGRIWHRRYTPFSSERVDEQIASGYVEVIRGVTVRTVLFNSHVYTCNRCHNDDQQRFTSFYCLQCNGPCAYCRKCLKMGRVSICTELIMWKGPALHFPKTHENKWTGTLSPQQQRATKQLLASTNEQRNHLVYAVCGSGKTEVLFQPIFEQLQRGKRICLAAPRVDVILELEPRLRQAFPKTSLTALYGGAEQIDYGAQLVLATTHQLYRFHEAFDLIIIDEADAFPYTADATLRAAVKKAAKQHAPIHLVTATPTEATIREYEQQQTISIMYRRYHNNPLPLPTIEPLWNYEKQFAKQQLPALLRQWTEHCLLENKPFLIFFHKIELMEQALPLFQQLDPSIQAVHAAHPNRKEYVEQLRTTALRGLLTTTILERGITIPNVQVAVVGAEQKVFNSGALIQIGGRVGRSPNYPTGTFTLFHHGISAAMDKAKRTIHTMNNKGGFT